jgi:hypothetical protein
MDLASLQNTLLQKERALRLDPSWKLVAERGLAQVWRLDSGTPHPYLRCTAQVPIPSAFLVEQCMERVVESQKQWAPGYAGGQVLFQEADPASGWVRRVLAIRHQRTALVVAPRAYVYFDGYGPDGAGTVQVSLSVDWHTAPRLPATTVLARLLFASRRITPAAEAGHSGYDAIWQVDLGGFLGRFPKLSEPGMAEAFFSELPALESLARKSS